MEILSSVGVKIIEIILKLFQAYSLIIIARIILSWFISPNSNVMRFLIFLTEPILAPIRKLLQPLMRNSAIPLDLSPLIALLAIQVITEILSRLFM